MSLDVTPSRADLGVGCDRRVNWSYYETKEFLSLWEVRSEEFKHSKRNVHVWEALSLDLARKGIIRSVEQCKTKWDNLGTAYKKAKASNNATRFEFFDDMERILGDAMNLTNLRLSQGIIPTSGPLKLGGDMHPSSMAAGHMQAHLALPAPVPAPVLPQLAPSNSDSTPGQDATPEDASLQAVSESQPSPAPSAFAPPVPQTPATQDIPQQAHGTPPSLIPPLPHQQHQGVPPISSLPVPESWGFLESKLLISLYADVFRNPSRFRQERQEGSLWANIAAGLARHGYGRSPAQCELRMSSLINQYRKCVKWNSTPGKKPRSYDLFKDMDAAMKRIQRRDEQGGGAGGGGGLDGDGAGGDGSRQGEGGGSASRKRPKKAGAAAAARLLSAVRELVAEQRAERGRREEWERQWAAAEQQRHEREVQAMERANDIMATVVRTLLAGGGMHSSNHMGAEGAVVAEHAEEGGGVGAGHLLADVIAASTVHPDPAAEAGNVGVAERDIVFSEEPHTVEDHHEDDGGDGRPVGVVGAHHAVVAQYGTVAPAGIVEEMYGGEGEADGDGEGEGEVERDEESEEQEQVRVEGRVEVAEDVQEGDDGEEREQVDVDMADGEVEELEGQQQEHQRDSEGVE